MKLNKRKNILLVAIVLLAIVLRFYRLAEIPPALNWDEAAWGYNAYSLSLYGQDEFGRKLPFDYLESFGDFKPPVYAYAAVLPVMIFGLNELATRFPSALFGSLTVIVTYFLVLQIFYDTKKKHLYGLLAAFFLAISPWHINISRAAFEANVATFFIVIGVWLFLKAVHEQKWLLILSAISFVLSMYTFNTARIVAPLLVLVLALLSLKSIKKNLVSVIIAAAIGFALLLPSIPFLLSPQASLRFKEVNIFSDVSIVEMANTNMERSDTLIGKVVNNRRVFYAREYIKHYFDNLSPGFLFIHGDGNPKFSTQDVGQLYLWSAPFLIVGILFLFRKREGKWWFIPVWLLIGIIPAATARETPHALRIETTLPTFQILVAYGVVESFTLLKKKMRRDWLRKGITTVIAFGLLLNVAYYLHGYYVHYSRLYSKEWQYGYEDSIAYVLEQKEEYDTIYITNRLGRPYVYYLFYGRVDPKSFQKTADIERDEFGFVHVNGFEKYRFQRELPHGSATPGILFINKFDSVPQGANILKRFKLLNGEDTLVAYTL